MSESFAELFEESLKTVDMNSGSIVMGEVVDIDNEWVTVHAGLKSEGVIPRSQFLQDSGELEVKIGDKVQVSMDAVDDGFGETLLSREKAKRAESWQMLEKVYESQEVITGFISGRVKGGFTVEVKDIRAFLPGSLVDVRPLRENEQLEGREMEFKVIKLDQKRNNVVVSRRSVLEQENSEEREALLTSLQEGLQVKGVVKNLTDYGAFVDLGGVDGLLHITDMAWKRIKHPGEIVEVGEEIDVKVLKFDRERNRVSLGLKQLGEDPWVAITKRYPEGAKATAKVTNLTDYGCFAEIEEGVEGLVHVSEMDWTNRNIHPSKVVQVGDQVEVMVLDIDEDRRRISLGIKQCLGNPWEEFAKTREKGDKIKGYIKSITDFGIFIGLDNGIDGLVHLSDLSWTESGDTAVRNYKKGDELKTILISADIDRERISLGVKQLTVNKFQEYVQTIQKGSVVKGKIVEKLAKSLSIELNESVIGTLKLSELASDKNIDSMQVEDELDLIITNIDKKNQAISLSMKVLEKQNENKELDEYNKNNESVGASLGDILKDQMDK